jgi:hypothetical protein
MLGLAAPADVIDLWRLLDDFKQVFLRWDIKRPSRIAISIGNNPRTRQANSPSIISFVSKHVRGKRFP